VKAPSSRKSTQGPNATQKAVPGKEEATKEKKKRNRSKTGNPGDTKNKSKNATENTQGKVKRSRKKDTTSTSDKKSEIGGTKKMTREGKSKK
jgi:hypothetical protein